MFLFSLWQELPLQIRHKIAAQFNIKKKGATEVFDNTIKSDGFMIKDIEQALNADAIREYVGTNETDTMKLWHQMIAKIEGRELPKPEEPKPMATSVTLAKERKTKKTK